MILHQPLQNVFIFNILTDFTMFLLVCLKFYYKMCGTMTYYIKHQKNLLHFFFDSFLTCNVLKITCSIPMEDFSQPKLQSFYFITTCLIFCLRNKRFAVTLQKFCPKGSYWIKSCESISFLVHQNIFNNDFIIFNAFLTKFNSFCDFKAYSKAPFSDIFCHVEATHLTFKEIQLTAFSMMWVFNEKRL